MRGRVIVGALIAAGAIMASGCQHIHEPWTNNGKNWKEQRFQTQSPDSELKQRLQTVQTDR